MILNSEPVKDWFGYTRRERRSAFILLTIIFIVIGFRYLLPEQNIEIENFNVLQADTGNITEIAGTSPGSRKALFAFDPNSASFDTLVQLGFEPREAGIIIKYRKMGGKFRRAADLRKFQGVDSSLVAELESYLVITPGKSVKADIPLTLQERRLLDINSCDSVALVGLPGIGPVLSARILKYRNLLGGFASVEQLKEVYGLPEETYDIIEGRLFADSSGIRKIKINTAVYRELNRIPYIEKYEVSF